MPSNKLFLAQVESRNFSFAAYGVTEEIATSALRMTVQIHCSQYDCDFKTLWDELVTDVYVYPVGSGTGFRDNEQIL